MERTHPAYSKASRRLLAGLLFCCCVSVLLPGQAGATVFRLFGAGPRAVAMGGAFSAVADDFTAAYHNPGGLLTKTSTRVGVGYQYAKVDTRANGTTIPAGRSHRDGLILGFAFTLPLLDVLKDKIAFGYNLYQPVDYVINIYVPKPSDPQFVLLESYTQSNLMNAAVAVELTEGLDVGAGVLFTSDLGGSLDLVPGIRAMQGTDAILTSVDQDAQPILSASVGLMAKPGVFFPSLEGLSLAFVWRDRYFLDLNIPVTILLGTIPLRLDFSSKLTYTPMMFTLGAAYRFTPDLLVALDVTYNVWSDFLSPSLEIDTEIKLPILPLELLPGVVEDPQFSDTITPRIGVEYRAIRGSWCDGYLRAGYAFDPSPVPEQTGWSNFLDGDKHVFSGGLGIELKRLFGRDLGTTRLGIQTVFQYQWITKTHHRKTADIPRFQINPGYPSIEGDGDVYFFGIALTAEYGES